MLAGLCRFYGGTPATYLALPIYQLRVLVDNQPGLEAEEQQSLILATSAPHMKPEARRRYSKMLDALAGRRRRRPPEAEAVDVIEHNPQAAAEWFAAQGVRVQGRTGPRMDTDAHG